MIAVLTDLLNLLDLDEVGAGAFRGTQPDPPNHHIVGGQIAAQALMAASRTAPDRPPNSLHVYFLRFGDARLPVAFDVVALRDGGKFSVRRVTAAQQGDVLMEGLASFTGGVDNAEYQDAMADAPPPDALLRVEEQLAPFAHEFDGWWVQKRAFETRYVDSPPRIAVESAGPPQRLSRIWLHADGEVPDDPVVNGCVVTYLSGLTLLEPATTVMQKEQKGTGFSALLDHAVWFHRRANFSDWLLLEQRSPSAVSGRALATGTIYNRSGDLVCTAIQEGYFGERIARVPA
ncbi:MAG: acyl-CoA thioesterase [Mycobacterium sp.]|jgi:acyl-CoA thioesterase-2|nr:Acyl-CoA thioesterase [Mycobacterium sp.]MDT5133061.1 acyl-CoA thioesterase [Mycobacterium sp.]